MNRAALIQFDPTPKPSVTDELWGKLTPQPAVSKTVHKLGIESMTFSMKK